MIANQQRESYKLRALTRFMSESMVLARRIGDEVRQIAPISDECSRNANRIGQRIVSVVEKKQKYN